MQIKNSLVLMTALTAGSAVARLHGHERRHHHHERGVGSWVTAVIDGKTVSWQNTYAGPTDAPAAAPPAPAATSTAEAPPAPAPSATEAPAKVADVKNDAAAPASSASPTSSSPSATSFGGVTAPSGTGDTYCGNIGSPYGSNIIQISENDLHNYNYTITLDGGSTSEEYKAYFWNSCTDTGALAGFFTTSFPLTVTIPAGGSAYVAVDEDSQGGFIGIPSSLTVPRSSSGSVTAFWGEYGFGTSINNGWSGFDVSAIQAQNAGSTNFPGLKITGAGQTSSITSNLGDVSNAYTSAQTNVGGIGGNIAPGPVALTATLNYSG